MRRDYIENMKSGGLDEFIAACEDLKNSKYVIAENKIAAVLKSIADNKDLYSMFGAALYGFDYQSTFASCVGGSYFTLPSDAQKAVALVFRILLNIDSGKLSLADFLEAYFYSESINESYARFCLELITPFETYCRVLMSRPTVPPPVMREKQADAQNSYEIGVAEATVSESYDDVNNKFIESLKSDAIDCLKTLSDFGASAIVGVIDRDEFDACLDGLTRSIKSGDKKYIISSFLGVKYAVAYFFKSAKTVLDVYKKLEYAVKRLTD